MKARSSFMLWPGLSVTSTQNTFGLRIMEKSPERVWVELDGSSRRAASVATENRLGAPGIVSDTRVTSLAVLLPGDGFPFQVS